MVPGSNFKRVFLTYPGAIKDNDDFVGTLADASPVIVDTAGFNYAVFNIVVGFTDVAMASCIVKSDDDSAMGSATTKYTFGGTGLMALPTATDDNKCWTLGIDLTKNTERYWSATVKAGDGTTGSYAVIWFDLYRGDEVPISDTQRGLADSDYI